MRTTSSEEVGKVGEDHPQGSRRGGPGVCVGGMGGAR